MIIYLIYFMYINSLLNIELNIQYVDFPQSETSEFSFNNPKYSNCSGETIYFSLSLLHLSLIGQSIRIKNLILYTIF